MVTFNNEIKSINGKTNAVVQGVCLSSDTKPTDVGNGSILLEMDTGKTYAFNAEGEEWIEVSSSGSSGGGGGDSDFSTAQVTVVTDAPLYYITGPIAFSNPENPTQKVAIGNSNLDEGSMTLEVILYGGLAGAIFSITSEDNFNVEVTEGDATVNESEVQITGDCTLSINVTN